MYVCMYVCMYVFIEGEEKREKEREKTFNVQEKYRSVVFRTPPAGDLDHSLGMYPDQETNWPPFSLQDDAQSTEQHQPEHIIFLILNVF